MALYLLSEKKGDGRFVRTQSFTGVSSLLSVEHNVSEGEKKVLELKVFDEVPFVL